MKTRRQALATLITAAALSVITSTASAQSKPTLNLFCWSEYVPEGVIKSFEKETGIKVNVENYDSNEKMLAKLLAGGAKYDLIQPSEYVVESLIKQGQLEPVDTAALENYKNLDAKSLNMPHDPGNKFSVPWMLGTVGIVVNTAKVKDEVKGYADVFSGKYKKRIVVLDDNREIVSWALAMQGTPINDITAENLAKVKPVIKGWLKQVKRMTRTARRQNSSKATSISASSGAAKRLRFGAKTKTNSNTCYPQKERTNLSIASASQRAHRTKTQR